jgi:ferredoxin
MHADSLVTERLPRMKRKIISIDESKCDGCGVCVDSCHEGAIQVIEGKARLVSETYCDGLGACLGECPQGAITIEERDAAAFDEKAVEEHLRRQQSPQPAGPALQARHPFAAHSGGGCPGSQVRFSRPASAQAPATGTCSCDNGSPRPSALTQWPIQLRLVPPTAPYFNDCHLLIAADCVAFALGGFHDDLLEGRALAIACPKLDDPSGYVEKLTAILSANTIRSITVCIMEVPCCRGLAMMVQQALAASGKKIPLTQRIVSLDGAMS